MVAAADVVLVQEPSNPEDGEHVRAVEPVDVPTAISRLRAEHAFEAELLTYVAERRARR